MFCSNCGEKLSDGTVFCSKCGFKVGGGISETNDETQSNQPANQPRLITEISKPAGTKALWVLSLIGFFLFPLGIVGMSYALLNNMAMFYMGFAAIHAVVAFVQGRKNKNWTITIMTVISIVLFLIYFFVNKDTKIMMYAMYLMYALVLSIVTFIFSRKKSYIIG